MRQVGQRFDFSGSEETRGTQHKGGSRSVEGFGFYYDGDPEKPAGLYDPSGVYFGRGGSFDEFRLIANSVHSLFSDIASSMTHPSMFRTKAFSTHF
jgi:hypothetical protein